MWEQPAKICPEIIIPCRGRPERLPLCLPFPPRRNHDQVRNTPCLQCPNRKNPLPLPCHNCGCRVRATRLSAFRQEGSSQVSVRTLRRKEKDLSDFADTSRDEYSFPSVHGKNERFFQERGEVDTLRAMSVSPGEPLCVRSSIKSTARSNASPFSSSRATTDCRSSK